ncbi:hypothetical protein CIK73_10320 [Brachybacterium alimentarium]|nr:hypothetical protein CIK73_10320 [Brachybacterium alimentarium]RCS69337.1 hypothetical protein CIK68_12170 [Brachybacterium alimentarium]RCS76844.1 hypothetical protein CIK70_14760 [Brachybacterium alimentarium]
MGQGSCREGGCPQLRRRGTAHRWSPASRTLPPSCPERPRLLPGRTAGTLPPRQEGSRDGTDGTDGTDGADGADGARGVDGPDGADGAGPVRESVGPGATASSRRTCAPRSRCSWRSASASP